MSIASRAPSVAPPKFERLLFLALLRERPLLSKLGGLALAGALLGLAVPELSRLAIDEALPTTSPRMLLVLSACAVLVGAHQAWAGWLEDSTGAVLGASVERSALATLFSASLGCDYARLRQRNAGWMSDTVGGAGDVAHGYVSMCVALVTEGLFALAYFAFLLSVSPFASALVVLVSLGMAALSAAFVSVEARLARRALDASSRQQELLHGLLGSLAALRGLFSAGRLGLRWQGALREATLAGTARARVATLRGLWLSGIHRALGIGVTAWAVYRCVASELGVGEMVMVTGMAAGLSGALLGASGAWLGFRTLAPQLERMNEVLAAAADSLGTREEQPPTDDRLLLEGVSFRYGEDERWILSDHSFELRRGEFRELESPSGSGKSTFLRLLAGLLTPARGRVRVFGLDAREARHLVLYVPQRASLLEASIGENLRLLSGASDPEIERVARLTGLTELLATLPMGVETPVAAQGQNFSSGQRQLIVLTAAFASPRPVLLLDEALSQIDAGTRRRMQWPALIADRTVIAVEQPA